MVYKPPEDLCRLSTEFVGFVNTLGVELLYLTAFVPLCVRLT